MNLFQWGAFTSASGKPLQWKIECDALTDEDWQCIANIGMYVLPPFGGVAYVPTGGAKLARAFKPYCMLGTDRWLVVDDVWTTGKSMWDHVETMNITDWVGFVAFSRGPMPNNVKCFMRTTEGGGENG